MTPASALAALDRQLRAKGCTIELRRAGTPPAVVSVRASVRWGDVGELSPHGSKQAVSVVISPAEIIAAGWPWALALADGTDTRVPIEGDRLIIAGRAYRIETAAPVYVADVLVRINLEAAG